MLHSLVMGSKNHRLSGWVSLILAFSFSPNAHAYECSHVVDTDRSSVTQVWRQSCVPYFLSSQSELLQDARTASIAMSSFDQWSNETQNCTGLNFYYGGYIDEGIAFDKTNPSNNHNVVTTLDTQEQLDELMSQGLWPDPDLVAITLTRFEPTTGEIVDADIVLNNVVFSIEEITPDTSCGNNSARHDLANTMVHEVGHLIGFAHVAGADATMFANATNCETKKRDLSMDDRDGVCTVYPSDGPIVTCVPSISGYNDSSIQAFRGQCTRYNQEPIEGCDCSSIRNTDENKYTFWSSFLLSMLVIARRSSKRKS